MAGRLRLLAAAMWVGTLLFDATAAAQEDPGSPEISLRDNSFLIEEAYNQEPGVVQHVFHLVPAWENGRQAERTLDFVFIQEWPIFSQRHQVAYSIPLRRIDGIPSDNAHGENLWGMGDVSLSYRYQLLDGGNEAFPLAVAPEFTLFFPTGDAAQGLGSGKQGYGVMLPISYELEKWFFHFNAALAKTEGVTAGLAPDAPFIGHAIDGYDLGGSMIYVLHPQFNLMLEALALWEEELQPNGHEAREFQAILLPGFRWAPYVEGNTMWVLGCGVPVGLSAAAPNIGIFFYMSFEHRFLADRSGIQLGQALQ